MSLFFSVHLITVFDIFKCTLFCSIENTHLYRLSYWHHLISSYTFWPGPFKVNGVPLRRVNQSYVIGTSTKVDISGVNVDKFDDKYFKKEAKKKKKKTEGEFFETEKEVCMLDLFSFHTRFSAIILILILHPVFLHECRTRKHFPRRRKMTKRLWMLP